MQNARSGLTKLKETARALFSREARRSSENTHPILEARKILDDQAPSHNVYHRLAATLATFGAGRCFAFLETNHEDEKIFSFSATRDFARMLFDLDIHYLGHEWAPSYDPAIELIANGRMGEKEFAHWIYATHDIPYAAAVALHRRVKFTTEEGVESFFADEASDAERRDRVEYAKLKKKLPQNFSMAWKEARERLRPLEERLNDRSLYRDDDRGDAKYIESCIGDKRFALVFGAGHADNLNRFGQPNPHDFATIYGDTLIRVGLYGDAPYRPDGARANGARKFHVVVDLKRGEVLKVTEYGLQLVRDNFKLAL